MCWSSTRSSSRLTTSPVVSRKDGPFHESTAVGEIWNENSVRHQNTLPFSSVSVGLCAQ